MIGKNNIKRIINFVFYFAFFFLFSCKNEPKKDKQKRNSKVEILNIFNKEVLNQVIHYKNNDSIDYSKSQFYEVYKKKCIKYYSFFDTLNLEIGKDRYILFKTSDSLKSDFSNINNIILEEFIFLDKNSLCLERKTLPKYGIIEDIVFLKTDSIIQGEDSKRIKTIYQYVNFRDAPKWEER